MNPEYYKLLKEFLSFKTISSDENFKQECKNCAKRLEDLFVQNKFKVKIVIKYWLPILIANYVTNPDVEKLLIYGNYDVTFADKKEWRKDDPYSLYLWKDQIIWKGVAEWKWILLLQMMTVFNMIKENKLKYNVVFLVDGERYIWSMWIKSLLQESLFLSDEWLEANLILSSIWHQIHNLPTFNTGFRWWFQTSITLKSANQKNSVSQWWWILGNPALEWAKLISKLYGLNNQISIPYFYYEVEEVSANQKTINWRIQFGHDERLENLGTKQLKIEDDTDFYTKCGYKPCIEVTSFNCGNPTDTIPESTTINISAKLVPNQKTINIQWLFESWIKTNIPNSMDYDVNFFGHADAVKIQYNNPYVVGALSILEKVYANKVVQISSSYTFPIIKLLQEKISSNIVNIPMVNETCNMHSVMENVDIAMIEKWYQFLSEFLGK